MVYIFSFYNYEGEQFSKQISKKGENMVRTNKTREDISVNEQGNDELGNLIGEFSWDFGHFFFIETERGQFSLE